MSREGQIYSQQGERDSAQLNLQQGIFRAESKRLIVLASKGKISISGYWMKQIPHPYRKNRLKTDLLEEFLARKRIYPTIGMYGVSYTNSRRQYLLNKLDFLAIPTYLGKYTHTT